jgi:hypothetical protein
MENTSNYDNGELNPGFLLGRQMSYHWTIVADVGPATKTQ